jgi:hypothetical protein
MFFGVAAMAADLPKEGTYSGTYSSVGTVKATAVGKERVLIAFDEYGLSLGKGITDRMRRHCSGLIDLVSGIGQIHGHCATTDPDGNQIAVNFDGDKFSPAAKTNSVMDPPSVTARSRAATNSHDVGIKESSSKSGRDRLKTARFCCSALI